MRRFASLFVLIVASVASAHVAFADDPVGGAEPPAPMPPDPVAPPTPPTPPPPPSPPSLPIPAVQTEASVPASEPDEPHATNHGSTPSTWEVGGFMQPQYRTRQDSPAPNDEDGFRFVIARLSAAARTKIELWTFAGYIELDLTPQVSLFDGFVTAARPLPSGGYLTVDVGQEKAPFSRQDLLRDSDLAFVEKAQIATLAPDRQLGLRANVAIPGAPYVRVLGGIFNGEGRNQVQNIDEKFMYVGRVEFAPFGRDVAFAESALGGDFLTLAGSVAKNTVTSTTGDEHQIYFGYDIAGAWHGLSGTFEYLQVNHSFDAGTGQLNYHANGFVAQANYLLPWYRSKRRGFELGVRVEEIDRNDTVPIIMIGDPNQSQREYTAVASYYLRGHSFKIQVAASHFTQIENQTASGASATYPEDEILAQVTYRLE